MMMQQQTYYEVLEISPDAELIDVKKAYRRLALKHHPDRNTGDESSTERFQQIGEAYEVLSDERRRAQYDRDLAYAAAAISPGISGRPSAGAAAGYRNKTGRHRRHHQHRNPFAQFDDLFRNDPFFNEAFRDMDDEFARRFRQQNGRDDEAATTIAANNRGDHHPAQQQRNESSKRLGWFPWLLRQCGIDFHMATYTSTADGNVSASSYSSNPRGAGAGYTEKKTTRSYVDSAGRRVLIQSLERNGNRIEDKYVNDELVERRVNGVVEPLKRIAS